VLAERIALNPQDLVIEEADWTKPRLALPRGAPPVFFNVSHSGDYVLVAISDNAEVGIDVEQVRSDCPIEDLARRYYSSSEHQKLRKLPARRRLHDFYRLWTIKEAVLKCAGLGLSVPPAVVEVRLSVNRAPEIRCLDAPHRFPGSISVRELVLADGYVSAVALESRDEIEINIL
jgi:4'-phosphopantetheinyl transferase